MQRVIPAALRFAMLLLLLFVWGCAKNRTRTVTTVADHGHGACTSG